MPHTPGPWQTSIIRDEPNGNATCVLATVPYLGSFSVADCDTFGAKSFVSDNERIDNATLIAAAPDLLEACKAALEEFQHLGQALGEFTQPQMVEAWNKVEAAIAKAKSQA